jgi:hypothetical protein
VRGQDQSRSALRARNLFSQMVVERLGHSGAAVAQYLGITSSGANRHAETDELPRVEEHMKLS